jgi:formylmethanofuran dehydrogenase subunit E
MQRQCTKCGEYKPVTEFHRRRSVKSGITPQCKNCTRIRLNEWRRANPDKRAAQNRRARPDAAQRKATYQRTRVVLVPRHRQWYTENREQEIAKAVRRTKEWRKEHPKEQRLLGRAWRAVSVAIEQGLLVRPVDCEQCGAHGVQIDAAHYDYREPLRVRWLCRRCHSDWDRTQPKLQYGPV